MDCKLRSLILPPPGLRRRAQILSKFEIFEVALKEKEAIKVDEFLVRGGS